MKDYLYELLQSTGPLSLEDIALRVLVSLVLGIVIFVSYRLTHGGSTYSRKFNVTLIMLTALTATVMTVVGNNITLSLGMVGALSIVRFRTAVKDARDTAYIFWTVVVGICCGVGDFLVAGIGSCIVFLFLFVVGRMKSESRLLLIIRAPRNAESVIESVIFQVYERKANLRVKNSTQESIEFIYELSGRTQARALKKGNSINEHLYRIEGMESVSLVSQSDEVGG